MMQKEHQLSQKDIPVYSKGIWILGWALFLGTMLLTTSCEEPFRQNQGSRAYHLPSGWKLQSNTQMLARSYPQMYWITMISRLKGESQHLFTTPYVAPPLSTPSLFGLGFRRSRRPAAPAFPGQRTPPQRKTTKKSYGFTFWFRCNHKVSLELRLPVRSRYREGLVYHYPFDLSKTGAKWKPVRFLYRDFKLLGTKATTAQMNPFLISHIEVWERKAKKHPFSVSLTIKGPILYRSKKVPKVTSHPTTRATSHPTTRATSHPTVAASRPAAKATAHPTTRPARAGQPALRPRK